MKYFKLDRNDTTTILPFLEAQSSYAGPGVPMDVSSVFTALPNAIKSLFLNLNNLAQTRYDWQPGAEDLMADAHHKAAFTMNYQNIKVVEVLSGFTKSQVTTGVSAGGDSEKLTPQTLINQPIWVPLTEEIFENSIGKNLFCRLTVYNNNSFGIRMPACLDLPVFHEHFILNPSGPVIEAPIVQTPVLFGDLSQAGLIDTKDVMAPDYTSSGVGFLADQKTIQKAVKDDLLTTDMVGGVLRGPGPSPVMMAGTSRGQARGQARQEKP